ncbi:MAG: DUF2442 domain-containing protein [Thermoguttaceae bacterium]
MAEPVGVYRISIRFSNGESGVVDLGEALWGPVFQPLKDPEKFKRFKVSEVFHTICWDNGADLAPEYLYAKMVEQRASAGARVS